VSIISKHRCTLKNSVLKLLSEAWDAIHGPHKYRKQNHGIFEKNGVALSEVQIFQSLKYSQRKRELEIIREFKGMVH
jgi:hypothetical protein